MIKQHSGFMDMAVKIIAYGYEPVLELSNPQESARILSPLLRFCDFAVLNMSKGESSFRLNVINISTSR